MTTPHATAGDEPAPPPPVRRRPPSTLRVLGLAAALAPAWIPAQAQTDTTNAPATNVPAPTSTEAMLPTVRAKVRAEPTGKDGVQATTTRIGKGQQELRDLPQSVTVVTEKLIDERNVDTLKDALHQTAGIAFLAAEGGEEDIRLRGFSLQGAGDIFVDGLRDPAFYERDTFNWDRLEVLRGSASMLFGRGSTGGAVNQVSKLPRLFQPNEISLTAGSAGYGRATLDLNLRLGDNAAARINAMATQADNHGPRIDKQGVAPSLRWGIGTADEFLVALYHLENRNGIHYGLPWLDGRMLPVDPDAYYGTASDRSFGTADTLTLGHVHRFADRSEWRTTLRVGAYTRDQRASVIRLAPAASQPGGVAVTQANFSEATVLRRSGGNSLNAKIQDLDALTFQSDYDTRFTAWGLKHSVQAGVDLTHDDFVGFTTANPPSGPLLKPDVTVGQNRGSGWVDESLRQVLKNRDFRSRALGLYAQDLVQLAPTWKLLAGLRWDRFEGRYRTVGTTASDLGAVTAVRQRTDALFSHRAGVLFQPTPLASWHLSYGTSFNTSGDAYQYDALGTHTPPERSRNLELGAKLDSASGNATLRLALFHATKTNERNRDETSVNATNYVLSGQRHATGLEVDLAGRLTPKWEIYLSYAFIPDAEIDKGADQVNAQGNVTCVNCSLQGEPVGSRPGLTPRHSGTVWTTYQLTSRWRVGGGLNLRSSDTPAQSGIVAPGYVTADLMAEYTVGPLAWRLNVTNLANKLYADVLYRGHYVPGKPRTVQLTGTYSF